MSTLPRFFITPEQYLERERRAEFRSEYFDGEIFAISGGSRIHDRIVRQLGYLLNGYLREKPCEMFTANMRVVTPGGLYTYPDLSISCGEPSFIDKEVDTLTNPVLLVEVLSPSTEAYDRGRKAELYRAIPSLKELMLVAQDRFHVELHRREHDGRWFLLEADGLDDAIELAGIGYTLRLADLYADAIAHGETGVFRTPKR